MAYSLEVEPGEHQVFTAEIEEKLLGEPFRLLLSTEALYFPKKKWFAVSDPYTSVRVPLASIQRVSVHRVFSPTWLLLGVGAGVMGAYGLQDDIVNRHLSFLTVEMLATAVACTVGIVGRRALVVETVHRRFVWKRPLRIKWKGRKVFEETVTRVLGACRTVGVHVEGLAEQVIAV